jgi:hypothetical protein
MENQDKTPKENKWTPEFRKAYQREYQKKYREKNGVHLIKKAAEWVANNRDRWNEYQREYKRMKAAQKNSQV